MKTKTQHTPGPWVTWEWPKPNVDGPYLKINVRHKSQYADGPVLAIVEAAHITHEADEQTRANARLIASAPELLEAAKLALGVLEYSSETDGTTAKVLRAAIAKASGEK